MNIKHAIEQMRSSPTCLRPEWVGVPVVRDYWLALNVGASEAWPRRLDYADLLVRLDDYVQGLGPMDRPGWLGTFIEVRDVVEAAIRADNAEEEWNGVVAYLEDLEAFSRFEQSEAADHLLQVVQDLERGPWFVSAPHGTRGGHEAHCMS